MGEAGAKRTVETRTMVFALDDNRMVVGTVRPGAKIDIEDAKENTAAVAELVGQKKYTILADIRNLRGTTREARWHTMAPENKKGVVAQAALVESAVSRIIAAFAIGVIRPPFPVKAFTDREKAVAWLREFDLSDACAKTG